MLIPTQVVFRVLCHTAKATDDGLSEVDIIADNIKFDSHGGDVNTGGWTLENYRKGEVE